MRFSVPEQTTHLAHHQLVSARQHPLHEFRRDDPAEVDVASLIKLAPLSLSDAGRQRGCGIIERGTAGASGVYFRGRRQRQFCHLQSSAQAVKDNLLAVPNGENEIVCRGGGQRAFRPVYCNPRRLGAISILPW